MRELPAVAGAEVAPLDLREAREPGRSLGDARRRRAIIRRSLAVADLAASAIALLVVSAFAGSTPRPATLLLGVAVLAAGKLTGLYDRDEVRLRRSTLEEVPALFQLSGICALLLWLGDGTVFTQDLGRPGVLALWVVLFAALCGCRTLARMATASALTVERCLIVGDPSVTDEVADKLAGRHGEVVGVLPFADARADLEQIVRRNRAHRIIVVPGSEGDGDTMLACISQAQEIGTAVSILPRISEVVGSSVEFDHVDGMVLLGVRRFGLSRSSWAIKRAVDIAGAGVGLLVLSPVLAAVAIAVRLDSRGPVFFRQPRVGHKGRHIEMIKFRSMYDGADRARAELTACSHAGDGHVQGRGRPARDARRTLPAPVLARRAAAAHQRAQGEMSLVGPRPLVLEEDKRIEGRHRRRLQLTPGMTGPWQVLGTADRRVPLREMVTLDYLYVGNWSLWTDVKILLRTALHVFKGHGL